MLRAFQTASKSLHRTSPIRNYLMSSDPIAKRMKSTKVGQKNWDEVELISRSSVPTRVLSTVMVSGSAIVYFKGQSHIPEALAVFMLRLTDEYKDADLVRTRDPAKRMPHFVHISLS